MSKFTSPSIKEKSFTCPHCGAFCRQFWFNIYAEATQEIPIFSKVADIEKLRATIQRADTREIRQIKESISIIEKSIAGIVFRSSETSSYLKKVENLHISECHGCSKISIWVNASIVYPAGVFEVECNSDMPDDIQRDFDEARAIVQISPRGACALLRLCVQKLCENLLGKKADINSAIADMVKQGLRIEIQQALDAVRVIGNEAVHPGILDLKDDIETAKSLFEIINIIVEDRISQPRKISSLYAKLPQNKINAISDRDSTS